MLPLESHTTEMTKLTQRDPETCAVVVELLEEMNVLQQGRNIVHGQITDGKVASTKARWDLKVVMGRDWENFNM